MSDQTVFTAEEWFDYAGRGIVANCIFDPPEPRDEAYARLIGKEVTIDGKRYIVRGVEGFAVTRPQNRLALHVEPSPPLADEGTSE